MTLEEMIEKYQGVLPTGLIALWKEKGLGNLKDGYFQLINPDEYIEILKDTYFRGNESYPIMVTAFGDIITWEENKYIGIVEYCYGTSKIMISNFDLFMVLLNDDSFTKKFFRFDLYGKLTKEQGSLENDECFGYVPLLALGGTEKIENIKKVKLKEHIILMSEASGMI